MGNYQSQPSRISERSADPAPIELSSRLIGARQRPSTLVENPLQINLFMQNKPNLVRRRRIANDVNPYNTTDYERKRDWTLGENKPNSNPNKANLKKAKMNINSLITKDYRKKDDFVVRINKPNLPEGKKMIQSVYLQRIMKKNAAKGYKKQTQTNPISRHSVRKEAY